MQTGDARAEGDRGEIWKRRIWGLSQPFALVAEIGLKVLAEEEVPRRRIDR